MRGFPGWLHRPSDLLPDFFLCDFVFHHKAPLDAGLPLLELFLFRHLLSAQSQCSDERVQTLGMLVTAGEVLYFRAEPGKTNA